MSDQPLAIQVSVIVPVYNDQAGVQRCLDALSKQNFPQELLEVVVVDNQSDPPLSLSGPYPFRLLQVVCAQPGSYAARNMGVVSSCGPVLAFTDADCVPDPEWIANGLCCLKSESDRAIVGGEVVIKQPHIRSAVGFYQYVAGFQQASNILRSGFSATANLFCYRLHWDRVGEFDTRLLSGGDRDWCWRAREKGLSIVYATDVLVFTAPRTGLKAAIRQARRVSAGRVYLKEYRLAPKESSSLAPHRNIFSATRWIVRHPELSSWDKMRVLLVAGVIKGAAWIEVWRIRFGARAERR